MLLDANDSQLVLVDYQVHLMQSIFEHETVTANAVRLVRLAQVMQVPVWSALHAPDQFGQNLPELQEAIDSAGGTLLDKLNFSAVADGLSAGLRPLVGKTPTAGNARSMPKHLKKNTIPHKPNRNSIVMAGCEAHVCLMQTALDLLDEDFEVWVVTDACSSRTERNRDAAFDRLAANGAELITTEMVAFEWLRTTEISEFADVMAIVR